MKKKWLSGVLTMALVTTTVASTMPAYTVDAKDEAVGKTYYVSSTDGKDTNNGLSENNAFKTLDKINEIKLQPGDKVLLEKGSVFENQALHLKGSGSKEAPIEVSAYGEGDRPKINTNGHGQWELNYGKHLDNQNHKWKGTVSSSILLEDVEYVEIRGLELTNDRSGNDDEVNDNEKEYNDPYCMDRTGVAGVAQNKGTIDHIVLDDLYIHDVDGNVYNKHMTNGGIYFIVEKPENEKETGIARYDDVQIRNCQVDTVDRWGIAVGYTYNWDKFGGATISDEVIKKYGSTNVVIENNYLNNVGGDHITTMYLDRPMVQYNVGENGSKHINFQDFSKEQPRLDANGNEIGKLPVGNGRVAAGIWPWKCKNAVFQYNECFKTLNAKNGNGDGQPWDADSGDGTNYQYNYSHGNTASTIMFCEGESINNTFRYNISQNEEMGPLDPAGNAGNTQVYNNTFYIKEGIKSLWYRNSGPVNMENNIFYFAGDKPVEVKDWNPSNNKKYDNNLYYNVSTYPNDANAVKVNAGTKVFVDAGKGPDAAAANKQARKHENPNEKTVFDGYKLAENSPAINKGKIVKDLNGYAIEHDFFGKTIGGVPEIGAAESDVVSLVLRSEAYTVDNAAKTIGGLEKNTTVKELKENVYYDAGLTLTVKNADGKVLGENDIVKGNMTVELSDGTNKVAYTIVANADNQLKETSFMVKEKTKTIYVPSTTKNPMTVGAIKSDVKVHETASVSVWNGDKEVKSGAVKEGMVVRITAENGTANNYKIEVKNEYQWAKDYVHKQQGNVWFAQMKKGGKYTNMTTVDKDGWPNWALDTYYGPGVDAGQGTTEGYGDETHGLISAPINTNTAEGTAMTFRAAKDGVVNFNIKSNEPYLRQDGNANGSVIVSLTVNGKEQQNCKLTESKKKGEFPAKEGIAVKKGDFIRVEAKNEGNPSKPSVHITPIITYQDVAVEDKEAPTKPSDLRVTDVKKTSVTVNWAEAFDNVDVAGYRVYVDGKLQNTDKLVEGTSYTVEGLQAGTTYKVEVAAVDTAGNESEKAEVSATTESDVVVVDKSKLQELYDVCKGYDKNNFTADSWKDFEKALKEAKKVLDDKKATQDEVDAAYDALEKAEQALVPVQQPEKVDKSKLQAAYDKYSKYDAKDYTAESWKNFAQALENAKTVLNDGEATQDEVDKALDALNAAEKALVKVKPITPEKPKPEQPKPEKPNKPNTPVKTGDEAPVLPLTATVAGMGLAIALLLKKRK